MSDPVDARGFAKSGCLERSRGRRAWSKITRALIIAASGAALVWTLLPAELLSLRIGGGSACAGDGDVELVLGTPLGTLRVTLR